MAFRINHSDSLLSEHKLPNAPPKVCCILDGASASQAHIVALQELCTSAGFELSVTQGEGSRAQQLNEAAKKTASEFLLFLSGATLAEERAILSLVHHIEQGLEVAAVAPGLVSASGRVPNVLNLIEDQCARMPVLPVTGVLDSAAAVPAALVEGLLVRKVAFWSVGGFDDYESLMAISADFGLKLGAQNWQVHYRPDCVLSYSGAPEGPTVNDLRKLSDTWYGKFAPTALRTPDGHMRPHPWEPAGSKGLSLIRIDNCLSGTPIPGERCSVIVVTYNSLETIDSCLRSVLGTLGAFDEVIVVDNNSQDATPEYLEDLQSSDPRLKVILNPENVGFSEGCNIGIRESDGEYTVLLNPDTNVPEGWLARMREYFADDSVGAVGPMSNYVAGVQQYGFHFLAGMAGSITAQEIQTLAQSINTRRSVESKLLIGFCMMLRRSVLDQVGLLDSELFLGCDDLDMSWRLRLAVYRLLVATDVFVLHKGHVSFDTEPQTKTDALVQKSTDVLARKLQKHYGEGNVPSPAEIWGIDWFTPSPDALETSS